jgi:dihydropteroate synthase
MTLPFRMMGVVNVTPDSFSDGGLFLDADAAVAHARELIGEGADIVDVGGESTRPGAEPVAADEELRRVLPVVEGIVASGAAVPGSAAGGSVAVDWTPTHPRVSIDTSKASVARAALDAGAGMVNDVSALRADPEMAGLVAATGAECCLMHMRGEPRTMQADPRYADVVDDVRAFLEERMAHAVREGVREERIVLDPGIGFGKTVAHNLELLRRLDELTGLGRPLVVGTSRKSFLGRILADAAGAAEPVDVARRLPGTIATNVLAYERGARVFRVHDVASVRAALAVTAATLSAQWPLSAITRTRTS